MFHPTYPRISRQRGEEGTVTLQIQVLANGTAGNIEVIQSSGHPILDKTALSSIQKWQFKPGQKGNQKAAMLVRIPVRFVLE